METDITYLDELAGQDSIDKEYFCLSVYWRIEVIHRRYISYVGEDDEGEVSDGETMESFESMESSGLSETDGMSDTDSSIDEEVTEDYS